MRAIRSTALSVFALMSALMLVAWPDPAAGQDARASEIIELNRRIMHQQIIERDPALFREVALDQFLVVFVETDEGWRLMARSVTPCIDMAIEHGFC